MRSISSPRAVSMMIGTSDSVRISPAEVPAVAVGQHDVEQDQVGRRCTPGVRGAPRSCPATSVSNPSRSRCSASGSEMASSSSTTSTRGFIQASYRRRFPANLSLLPLSEGFDRTTQAPGVALPHRRPRRGDHVCHRNQPREAPVRARLDGEPIGFRLLAWGLFLLVLLISWNCCRLRGVSTCQRASGSCSLWTALVASSQSGAAHFARWTFIGHGSAGLARRRIPLRPGVRWLGWTDWLRRHPRNTKGSFGFASLAEQSADQPQRDGRGIGVSRLGVASSAVWPWAALAGLLALLADCVVNYSLGHLATSLLSRRSISNVSGRHESGQRVTFILAYVCLGFLGVLWPRRMSDSDLQAWLVSWRRSSWPARVSSHWRRLDEAEVSIQAKNDALRSVDERIADERRDERAQNCRGPPR